MDEDALNQLRQELPGKDIYPISGATRQGLDRLLEALWRMVHPQAD